MYDRDFSIAISGVGKALGANRITNRDLIERFDLRIKEFFVDRFIGAKERYFANDDQTTSDLAAQAARQALRTAQLSPNDLDRIIVATSTPDYLSPSTACIVQSKIGAQCPAYDVANACSGFIYALDQAIRSVATGDEHVLVVGADLRSRTIDPSDRKTVFLYGDGAGAVVVSRKSNVRGQRRAGFEASVLFAEGDKHRAVFVESVGRNKLDQAFLTMSDGEAVSKDVIGGTPRLIDTVRAKANLELDDIDFFVFHQPNGIMLRKLFQRLGMAEDRTMITFPTTGNTVAASVPIALSEAWEQNLLSPGRRVLLGAVGAGITGGAHILTWSMEKPRVEELVA